MLIFTCHWFYSKKIMDMWKYSVACEKSCCNYWTYLNMVHTYSINMRELSERLKCLYRCECLTVPPQHLSHLHGKHQE